jgi:hypothetical protein
MTSSRAILTSLLVTATAALAAFAIGVWWTTPPDAEFFFWLGACFVSEVLWIRLPLDRVTVSMASAINFAAVLLLMPGEAMAVAAFASLPAEILFMRKPPIRAFYNAGQITLAVGGASLVLHYANVATPALTIGHPQLAFLPLLAAAAVYYLINRGAVSMIVALNRGIGLAAAWIENFGNPCDLPVSGAALSIGAMLAFVYLHSGMVAVTLVIFPLMVACDGYRRYLAGRAKLDPDDVERRAA